MHFKYLLTGVLLTIMAQLNAQQPGQPQLNYKQLWKEVEAFQEKGLPESALKIVDRIYAGAKLEKNSQQLVKSILYQLSLAESYQEDVVNKNVEHLKSEIESATFPVKHLLYSVLAETYWQYYENNRYRFRNRTETVNFQNNDLSTWSLEQLVNKTIESYLLSLENGDKLKSISIMQFEEVLIYGNKMGKDYRPTLYDFLAHRAVDLFMNNEPDIIKPAYSFSLNDADYFNDAAAFAKLPITTRDTFAYKYYALRIFQDLIKFHQTDQNPDALVDVDLKRLEFINQYSTLPNKRDLYLKALQSLDNKYKAYPISTMILMKIAQVWNGEAGLYNESQPNEHRMDKKKAYDICEFAIKRFPESNGAKAAYNLQQEIKMKNLEASVEKVNVPGLPFRALVTYKNFTQLYWRVLPVTPEEIKRERERWEKNYDVDQEQKLVEYLASKTSLKKGNVTLPADSDFNQHSVEVKIDDLPVGKYAILFSNNENFSVKGNGMAFAYTTISNIAYYHRNRDDGSSDLFVVDRTSGEPVAGAKVQVFLNVYNENKRRYELVRDSVYRSDDDGFVKLPYLYNQFKRRLNNVEFLITNGKDTVTSFAIDNRSGDYYGRIYQTQRGEDRRYEQTFFFLDRAIYRPGQSLYYKGLLVNADGRSPKIIPDRKLSVTFYDVNSQVVGKQEVVTNKYGTFSGTFSTPSAGLMGQMSLVANDDRDSRIYFSVEEYKRPKFEVKFDSVKSSLKLGEKVTVNGKALAYSGANIDGANVQYRVVRRAIFPFWWWCWYGYYPSSPEMEIVNGKDTTNTNGSFDITFTAIPDETVSKTSSPTFIFQVYADVTDINGETHSSSISVNIGYKALMLGVDVKDIDKSKADSSFNFKIKTTNLEGAFEPAQGNISIWKLKTPAAAYRERFWQKPDKFIYSEEEFHRLFPNDLYKEENNFYKWDKEKEVVSKSFNTSTSRTLALDKISGWDAGKYMLQITAKDKFGEEVKEVAYFEVSDYNSDKPVIPVVFEVKEIKTSAEPGEQARILVSASRKVKYLYEIEQDGRIIDKQWASFNNGQKLIEIPIKEDYRGNIAVHLVAVKDNRMYANSQLVTVPYTNKELDIKFETFRDKLQPGQQEQWKIKISPKTADKIMAEMVATLYDASLDAFVQHQWQAQLYDVVYSRLRWQSLNGFGMVRFQQYDNNWNLFKHRDFTQPEYPLLNRFYYTIVSEEKEEPVFLVVEESAAFDAPAVKDKGDVRLKKAEARFAPPVIADALDETEVVAVNRSASGGGKGEEKKEDFSNVQVRKNFNETAFFYPHLQTDDKGEIVINFTIPEALTRWKMLGFAHTADLKSGMIQKELVTQKDLMVVPNQPRFFRENDKMIFQAKINSLADKNLEGQARLEFFDALTMQPVDNLLKNENNIRDFSIKAGQSINLEWNIEIPENLQAISYRIVAKAGDFSDGEEMILPVVTNRTLVTESLPLPIRGKQTKEFKFDKLLNNTSSTIKNHRYTLEFTSNPAWYAVQALPYLMEYPYECTEQTFSRFYANSIASHIANSNPMIKKVFDTWANIQPDALLSSLEKNQELKTALLQETPWVLNAKDESQRKRNVALLFDMNRMANEKERAMNKILDAQLSNGGFSWFPGLPDDVYVTQYIVTGMGHLNVMGVTDSGKNSRINTLIARAIAFMDDRMQERYNYLKAEAKKGNVKLDDDQLGYYQIQYLYARSYFKNIELQEENREAFAYWTKQAEKYWMKENIYGQGMLALALYRQGKDQVSADIVKSLKERSLHSEEMGMYWKLERGYFWYQAPIETQSLMIEVFDEVAKDLQSVEDMKVWLLKQKQTQDWKTTKATSEACYALLRRGTDMLVQKKPVEITVGKEKVDPAKREDIKTEAGTGYFKTAWTASEIKPEMGNITVKKTDDGVAWGAAYWQYFEQLDKITTAETPLKLSKKLFKQVNTDRGPVITPITDTTRLTTGDLVRVRIELRADRTMEYIHLKDMRASAFEPVETLSGYKYQDGLWYYQSPGDLATNFFIGYLPKGTYVFEYSLRASQLGDFSNGITTIQCMYAPEFSSHSEGVRVKVGK